MYGTVARLKVKPGMEAKLSDEMKTYETLKIPGFLGTWVYKMDSEPNIYYLAVGFQDKNAYEKNANDPAQDARYRRMVQFLDGEPEWHDGEIIYSSPMG